VNAFLVGLPIRQLKIEKGWVFGKFLDIFYHYFITVRDKKQYPLYKFDFLW